MTDPTVTSAPDTLFAGPGSTDPVLDDQAAEVDEVPPDAGDGDGYIPNAVPAYSGVCVGGPYAGRTVTIRFPGGFLLYDKPNNRLWTYDAPAPGQYVAASGGSQAIDPDATAEQLQAAVEGIEYDVLAYDDGSAVTP